MTKNGALPACGPARQSSPTLVDVSDCRIFVSLLDEGVDVWRPVLAEQVGGTVYRICEQPYDRDTEAWQFEPGSLVVCEQVNTDDGSILAAKRRATGTEAEG